MAPVTRRAGLSEKGHSFSSFIESIKKNYIKQREGRKTADLKCVIDIWPT